MKKLNLISSAALILLFISWLSAPAPAYADILEVLPKEHDFGDVELGTTITTIVTMTNINSSDITVDRIEFQAGSSGDFSLLSCPATPFDIVPAETAEVEVAFTPSAEGYVSAMLEIESTDSLNPTQEVFFGGAGVAVQPPPVSIQAIIEFFDESVAAETLDGTGPSDKSKKAHRKVFRFLLLSAATLIEGDNIELACHVLERAYIRSDGMTRPPDFVTGEACIELNVMIGQLMADMGCE